jgi:hypothetical protein
VRSSWRARSTVVFWQLAAECCMRPGHLIAAEPGCMHRQQRSRLLQEAGDDAWLYVVADIMRG